MGSARGVHKAEVSSDGVGGCATSPTYDSGDHSFLMWFLTTLPEGRRALQGWNTTAVIQVHLLH
eukprot:10512287-Prorocentrum_lima.AAC.1